MADLKALLLSDYYPWPALRAIGIRSDAIPSLVELAADDDVRVATRAIAFLALTHDEALLPRLFELCQSTSPAIRASAAMAVAELGIPDLAARILDQCARVPEEHWASLIVIFSHAPDRSVEGLLLDVLSRTCNPALVRACGCALEELISTDAVPHLMRHLLSETCAAGQAWLASSVAKIIGLPVVGGKECVQAVLDWWATQGQFLYGDRRGDATDANG